MKRLLFPMVGLALAGVVIVAGANLGQAQIPSGPGPAGPGPGNQGSSLRVPWLESSPVPQTQTGALPPYAGGTLPGTQTPFAGGSAPGSSLPFPLAGGSGIPEYQEKPDPNQDILVTPGIGPWMICIHWYSGPDAPQMARKMVMELRSNPAYKLSAYVFSKGAEERREEYKRIKEIVDKQREFFRQNNLPQTMPIRIPHRRIEEQCAVLVGDYKDTESARRSLDQIRKLPPPDPKRVDLSTMFYQDKDERTGKVKKEEAVYVNPFTKAFVVRNPVVKVERPADWDKPDMAALQKLNRGESFSLLNCKKKYTLVVKQFTMPTAVQPRSASGKFLETLGLGSRTDGIDNAAHNAHNLAELLRKNTNMEAYVLHTRFASIVSVGGFDSPDDPSMRAVRDMLMSRLNVPGALPMAVPR